MLPRRLVLTAGATLALAPLAACGTRREDGNATGIDPGGNAGCDRPEALESFAELGGAPLAYAETGNRQAFNADPRFIGLLRQWAGEWVALAALGPLTEVSTFGAHVDKCPSLHARGRAFDFAGLTHEAGNVSCRYDEWGEDPARRREYWRLAASLSSRFTYTLTYAYNAQHHNHIHVDNGVNGYDDPVFQSSSRAQTQVVQGVLRHVFNAPVTISGDYDPGTVDAVREVQRSAGITARLATTEGWRAFLAEAVRA